MKYYKPTGKLYERNNNCSRKGKQAHDINDADKSSEAVALINSTKTLSSVSTGVSKPCESIAADTCSSYKQMVNDTKSMAGPSISISKLLETVPQTVQKNTSKTMVCLPKESVKSASPTRRQESLLLSKYANTFCLILLK